MMTIHHIYKYSQVHNTKTICLFELFQKHSSIQCNCTITGSSCSLKTIDRALTDLKKAQNTVSKYTPSLGFHEISDKKHPHITILQNWH